MGWDDLYKPWTWPGHAYGGLKKTGDWLAEQNQHGDPDMKGIDRANFDLPGFQERNDRFIQNGQQTYGPSSFRQGQQSLSDMLMRRANGQDSLSQEQLKHSMQQNMAAQRSFAASAAPQNSAMAARMAGQNLGNLNQQMAGQQAMAGIAERMSAAQQAAGVMGAGRAGDLADNQLNSQNKFNWGQLEQRNAENQQQGGMDYERNRTSRYASSMNQPSNLETWGNFFKGFVGPAFSAVTSDERQKKNVRNGMGDALKSNEEYARIAKMPVGSVDHDYADAAGGIEYVTFPDGKGGVVKEMRDMKTGKTIQSSLDRPPPRQTGVQYNGLGTDHASRTFMYDDGSSEDERVTDRGNPLPDIEAPKLSPRLLEGTGQLQREDYSKLNLGTSPETQRMLDFNRSLKPKTFEYRDPAADGAGRRLGVMAQDVEKTPMGAQAVVETPHGKALDLHRLYPALAAGLGALQERLDKLDGGAEKPASRSIKGSKVPRFTGGE